MTDEAARTLLAMSRGVNDKGVESGSWRIDNNLATSGPPPHSQIPLVTSPTQDAISLTPSLGQNPPHNLEDERAAGSSSTMAACGPIAFHATNLNTAASALATAWPTFGLRSSTLTTSPPYQFLYSSTATTTNNVATGTPFSCFKDDTIPNATAPTQAFTPQSCAESSGAPSSPQSTSPSSRGEGRSIFLDDFTGSTYVRDLPLLDCVGPRARSNIEPTDACSKHVTTTTDHGSNLDQVNRALRVLQEFLEHEGGHDTGHTEYGKLAEELGRTSVGGFDLTGQVDTEWEEGNEVNEDEDEDEGEPYSDDGSFTGTNPFFVNFPISSNSSGISGSSRCDTDDKGTDVHRIAPGIEKSSSEGACIRGDSWEGNSEEEWDGEEVGDEGSDVEEEDEAESDRDEEDVDEDDEETEEKLEKLWQLHPQLVEHRSVLPPSKFRGYGRRPLPLKDFVDLTSHPMPRMVFLKVENLLEGNGTSSLEVVRSILPQREEFGLPKGSLWVMKRFKTSGGTIVDGLRAQSQLKRESDAYWRIAEAPKAGKAGFEFLMTMEATITLGNDECLIMPLMSGDLRGLMEDGAIHRNDVRRIMAQTGIGLATLHSIGIIHSDMKPENIFIDGRGNVKIGDFGLSHVSRTMLALDERGKYSDAAVGTPGYVAPEEKSGEKYGIEVDYWALGCIFYEMVAEDRDEDDNVLAEFEDSEDLLDWADALPTTKSRLEYYQNEGFDEDTLTLLCGLLDPNPEQRLGIAGLIAHPYFQVGGRSEFSQMRESALERQLTVISFDNRRPLIRYTPLPPDGTDFRWVNPYGACVPGPWRTQAAVAIS